MADRDLIDRRTLVHAPVGRDAVLTQDVLKRADLPCHICGDIAGLCEELEQGAGRDHPDRRSARPSGSAPPDQRARSAAGLVRRAGAALRRRGADARVAAHAADARAPAQRHAARSSDAAGRARQHAPRGAARPRAPVPAPRRADGAARGTRRGGARQSPQGRVPRDAVARAADAAQRHPRLGVDAADRARRRSTGCRTRSA